jgi:alpha-ketoglutarate-dependent taurine dioxygenase
MAVQASDQTATVEPQSIEVSPLSIHTGAVISGVDLSKPLPDEQVRDIRAALLKWRVVFFRDQEMTHEQHIVFGRQFGDLTPGHAVYGSDSEYPEIYAISKHRTANSFMGKGRHRPWTGWHSDITAAINPPMATILRGVIVPPYGGDTQFTNTVAAYNALSPSMQAYLGTLHGIFRNGEHDTVKMSSEYDDKIQNRRLVSKHPLIRVHPETGERALYVAPTHLKEIDELTPNESAALLEMLWEHVVRPEFVVRFKWEPGSVAFWDNRATCHLAPSDIFASDFDRQFYRITLVGDVPVGIDGAESESIEGAPILAV